MKVFTLKFPPVEGASHYEVVYSINSTTIALTPLVSEIPNLEAEEGTSVSGSVTPVIGGKVGTPVPYSLVLGEDSEGPVFVEITAESEGVDPAPPTDPV